MQYDIIHNQDCLVGMKQIPKLTEEAQGTAIAD